MRGGRGEQRHAPDVDHLEGLVDGDRGGTDLWREGSDVDDHDVDGLHAVLGEAGHVRGDVTPGQDACVDLGVEGLDLAAHDWRQRRQVGEGTNGQASRFERLARPVGGVDLYLRGEKSSGQFDDPVAVRDREEGTHSVSLSCSGLAPWRDVPPARSIATGPWASDATSEPRAGARGRADPTRLWHARDALLSSAP